MVRNIKQIGQWFDRNLSIEIITKFFIRYLLIIANRIIQWNEHILIIKPIYILFGLGNIKK